MPPPEASKAAEWLLDNEYHVRRAVRQVREDMSPAFYRRLARSALPEARGAPRVFVAAADYLDSTHAQVDVESAKAFVEDFQGEEGFSLAELWAFPTMLRLVTLEQIVSAFSHIVPTLVPPFDPIEDRGRRHHPNRDPTEAISRSIVALSALERIDWPDFVEETSRVEAVLRGAPCGLYAGMDFETRDRYRGAVEDLAEGSGRPELEIAVEAIRLCGVQDAGMRRRHVGWWLVDDGRRDFERLIGYRSHRDAALRRFVLRRPGPCYATALVFLAVLSLLLPLGVLALNGVGGLVLVLVGLLLLMPASIIAVTVVNWLVTQIVPPRILPKMDFSKGLPEGVEAAVIVPAILRTAADAKAVLSQLERHMLTNTDRRLSYALLSDPADAPTEVAEGDAAVESALIEGIRGLNRRYAEHRPFVLLHRRRSWCRGERRWMAWERKRGKIEQFNELLDGEAEAAFPVMEGDIERLRKARFVVTLDTDTVAPPGSVHKLLGALAHPLNRAEFDGQSGRVVAGYTVIQPRVEISPDAGAASPFTRLYTGDTAIDIYSRAVSDVYQDLFGEGIYAGKGAYDPDAFRRSLDGRVPENALLSHDLFEGLHGRAALASDVVFYEAFPARYPDFAKRMHRWIRGDWQLLPWLGRTPPGRGGRRLRKRFRALDRWKIVDNLRRSLIAPSLVLLALCGWLAMPGLAPLWTFLTVAAPGSYLVTHVVSGISRGRRRGTVQDRWRRLRDHAGRWILEIVFMANETVVSLSAIGHALWRLGVSRRGLLEWTTAAQAATEGSGRRARYWRDMAGAPLVSVGLLAVLVAWAPTALPGAAPLLLLWFASPEVAFRICQPWPPSRKELTEADRTWLRGIGRRTWAYFETFAGPEDNWLAPDNHQTDPEATTAHRSSPTNIGMQLLSSLAAFDLGFISLRDLAQRTEYALDALDRIERHKGHPVNWFDTRTLVSLEPRYLSTVDSGNLAVALLTLREGLLEAAEGPALSGCLWDGLIDPLGLLSDAAGGLPQEERKPILEVIEKIRTCAEAVREDPVRWRDALTGLLERDLPQLAESMVTALETAQQADPAELHFWFERSRHHAASFLRDLDAFYPWLPLVRGGTDTARTNAPTLPEMPSCRSAEGYSEALSRSWTTEEGPAAGQAVEKSRRALSELRSQVLALASRSEAFAMGMDFRSLYDSETRTFFIGYNLSVDRMDEHRYDLLASEARLASYFAIAKGDVPAEHWFHLGRPISRSSGPLTILSWNGSMFEFLMPALLIRSAPGQLLGQSERAAVEIQRTYGERLGLPWGVSESAFASRDTAKNYQYRAFGVAGLGLRHGLAEDYVVAPYASALALAVSPTSAVRNLRRLERLGIRGQFGFYDAVDFTPSRVIEAGGQTLVKTFMAHHQGMLLSAVENALGEDILVRRFNRDARIAAIDLLLHERIPWEFVPEPLPDAGSVLGEHDKRPVTPLHGWLADEGEKPQFHTIGNGRLAVWLSAAGTGSTWWNGQSLTRHAADLLSDEGSSRIVLRDVGDDRSWDFRRTEDRWVDVTFHPERASYHVQREGISATQEVGVAAADDIEIRRVTLVNHGDTVRDIEVTSYAEPVLAPQAAHDRHPAFSKLFIQSEGLPDAEGILFVRRPRRPEDTPPVMLHRLLRESPSVTFAGMETDRRQLLGRHGTSSRIATAAMSGTTGWTLDPVAALRARVRLDPGARASFAFLTIAAASREEALSTADRYSTAAALDWAFQDAERSAAVEAARYGMSQGQMAEAQALAGYLLRPPLRDAARGEDALPGQPDLWGLGISGDLPIVLVRVTEAENFGLLPSLVRSQRWVRRNGLRFDLLVLGTTASSYEAPIGEKLREALRDAGLDEGLGGNGGVHLHSIDRISPEQVRAVEMLAHLSLDGAVTSLSAALPPLDDETIKPPVFQPGDPGRASEAIEALQRPSNLVCDNGIGGFLADSGDYLIHLEDGQRTPVPWCNVIANDSFGTIVSEAGLGFTWSTNSGEFRLTPWSNDPVTDLQGEALFLRDEESARVWTVTQAPAGDASSCQITHRAGETQWMRASQELVQELSVTVPEEAPVKLVRLKLTNATDRHRRITATYYAEWQLGAVRSAARQVRCGYHASARALTARSGWAPAFADQVAFLAASRPPHAITSDRSAFLGPGGLQRPEGLRRWGPWGRTDAVDDPCAVYQVHLEIEPHGTEEVVFVLGAARGLPELESLVERFTSPEAYVTTKATVAAGWARRLGAVEVETPDETMNLLVNRWLPYQSYASRIQARAGFQQASGGIGFRDQLQDLMAFLHSEPARVRDHIIECARHQFEEGDVLHWWHPPENRGVRTRCSDDMLWLVYATHAYVRATGDESILDEELPCLSAPELAGDEEDRYAAFRTGASTSLLEHCRLALRRASATGSHGLPLIGSGDWNDGMDRVGRYGRGESVWLAWFAAHCGKAYADLADRVGRTEEAAAWRASATDLQQAAERAGWDGAWYRRAFDDEGEPWGSSVNTECRIDSIAQSWAVLSGAPDAPRAEAAVRSAASHLIDPEHRLVRLLAPAFDKTPRDPGYIRAYPPGIRENGGQYTHAATWLGLAFARLGQGEEAYRVFDLINPIRRSATERDMQLYRGEPYVMPADVGGAPPFEGRAGWTWYTGAAAWSWRLAVEGILGLELRDGQLHIAPCLPEAWEGYRATVRGPGGAISVEVRQVGRRHAEASEAVGGPGRTVEFPTDGTTREVRIVCLRDTANAGDRVGLTG
ncbi:cellobiose phosphorylase [Histidinibacterium aquaticum]|uniref:Cellobiose phosphorylase n=2 Tax=Histidinibacterium aquaticum TaxID=2613962 RepID=A0A5J5GGK4_9RHOB|nr:cellobiose phosphorylase [Histidinibacterium aquaticum]